MAMPKGDAFEKWVREKKWPEVREQIKDDLKKGCSQREISERLGMNEATLSRLKKHKEFAEVFEQHLDVCRNKFWAAVEKKAFGGKYQTKRTIVKEGKGKEIVKQVIIDEREEPPDTKMLLFYGHYHLGIPYPELESAIELLKQKEENKEKW